MQTGEVLRRVVFNLLDAAKGGRLKKLKEVNKREIVEGVTPEYMERRIDLLLDYVKKHSPYYKKHPEWTKLEDFPVMTKGDFLEHYEEVLVENSKEQGNLYRLSTSGSTGTPFTVLCDGDKMNRVNMNFISCMELNGFRLGMKRGEFRAWIKGKNTISMWKSFKNNLVMVDISNMGDDSLEKICKDIEKKKIQVLVTYSSALTALTGYIRRTGRDISKWKVEMVFSMGEALPDATYELTKEIFGYSPVRSYGNNENGFIAIQLGEDREYTIDLYNFYPEVLKMNSDEPAEPGELGRLVVTDYYNKTFPMVRYDTGDTGIMRMYQDEKGRMHGKYVEIYGRRGSLMYNCMGEPLSIHVFMNTLLKFEGVVYQAKCIQWGQKEYELLVNADRKKLVEEDLIAAYRHYLGEEAEIRITYVDEIPIQASGKFMVCEGWKEVEDMKQKVSDYIADRLAQEGICQVFTVTGGGAMHLNDSLGHHPGLSCLYQHHEQAAAMAAEAYARVDNRMAAVCVTSGPGATNAITGVLCAWMDSIPMIVLSGQVRYDTTVRHSGLKIRTMGVQEYDITPSVDPMTKYAVMVTDPLTIRYHLERAIYLAKTGRPGPCWLDLPLNIQSAIIETDDLRAYDPKEDEKELPAPVTEEMVKKILDSTGRCI